jgi:zinc protease
MRLLISCILYCLLTYAAQALEVKEIEGAKGVKAWFVEDHGAPVVNMRFAFAQGSAEDPAGEEGTALFLSGLVDEGTLKLDGAELRARMEDIGMRMGYEETPDNFQGRFMAPSASVSEAAELLRQSLAELSFPEESVERMRQYFVLREQSIDNDPTTMANRAGLAMLMAGHPYQEVYDNVAKDITNVSLDDLRAAHKRIFAKRDLKVALVGDLTEQQAKDLLDKVFGDLPEGSEPKPVPNVTLQAGPALKVIEVNTPQTLIMFGGPAVGSNDPDYLAQHIASYIALSTLNQIARQERGLTYGVSYEVMEFDKAAILAGRLRTSNANAGKALEAIKESFRLLRSPGPTQSNVEGTVRFLNGKFALGFDSGMDVATTLLTQMLSGFSSNYINLLDDLQERVTLADVERVIDKIMDPDKMFVVAVGKPEGLPQ